MIKIVLIRPSHSLIIGHPFKNSPPYGLYELKAWLDAYTPFQTHILDLAYTTSRISPLAKMLSRDNFDIFGITALSASRFEAIKIAQYIKKINPKACVIVGGVHFTHCAEDTLTRVREIDIVVHGEGGRAIVELAKALDRREWIGKIKGISYRDKNQIVRTADSEHSEDLDIASLHPKVDLPQYREYVRDYPVPTFARGVIASRGCPARCVYCSNLTKVHRVRNPKNIIDEIKFIKQGYGLRGINFLDSALTADFRHVEALCREMIDNHVDVKWWCESRVDIPLGLLDIMKDAGCVSLAFGLESGSQRILSTISKGTTVQQVMDFAGKCNALGIYAKPFCMFSLPGETEHDAMKTLNLLDELERYPFTVRGSFQPAMIFPGSKLEALAREKEILRREFSWCEHYETGLNRILLQLPSIPIYMETDKMTPDILKRLYADRISRLLASSFSRRRVGKEFSNLLKYYPSILRYNLLYLFSYRIWKKGFVYFSAWRKKSEEKRDR